MPEISEIDQLLDEGLTLYSKGDVDGALVAWQQALLIDPHNEMILSYVDYVRDNYDLLLTEMAVDDDSDGVPFAIGDDDPDYQIEIIPGEIEGTDAVLQRVRDDTIDSGWFISDDEGRPGTEREPPRDGMLTLALDSVTPGHESFEDATREYQGAQPRTRTPAPTSDFSAEITPGSFEAATPAHGFSAQADHSTAVRERDLGFVKPREWGAVRPPDPPTPERTQSPSNPPLLGGPNLEAFDREQEGLDLLGEDPVTREHQKLQQQAPSGPEVLDSLLDDLPRPTPVSQVGQVDDIELAPRQRPNSQGPSTRELPGATRPPAPASKPPPTASEVPAIHSQPTRELHRPVSHTDPTRDFGKKRTDELPNNFQVPGIQLETPEAEPTARRQAISKPPGPGGLGGRTDPPIDVAAPTRDLGLRARPGGGEDEPTVQAFARAVRGQALEDSTRADVVLPFDPIDARSAQILDEIDEEAPANESGDDRTRRRITTLFERALAWDRDGEHDKAVAAVDLALAEDPSSALAQKLIHRNRDTMQTVFQNFLGDLERQPALARPLHELAQAPISPRAAFLLSRVDGTLSLDEILDVSGMPRLEAFRYLCQLFLRGILR